MENEFDKSLTTIVLPTVFVVCVLSAFYIYYNNSSVFKKEADDKTTKVMEQENKAITADELPVPEQLKYLKFRSEIVDNRIVSSVDVDSKELPLEILSLLLEQTEIKAQSVVYENQKSGYTVSALMKNSEEDNIEKEYLDFFRSINTNEWERTKALHTKYSGLLVLENSKYEILLELTYQDKNFAKLKVNIVIK